MSKLKVAILISGGGSNMVSLLTSMEQDHPCEPVLVLSNDPSAGGLVKAQKFGVSTKVVDHRAYTSRADFDSEMHRQLEAAGTDIVCLAGFMRILTPEFVEKWHGKCLNIHPSLLPEFKGLNTHQRALDAGVLAHGCTVHEVTPDLDEGPILGQAHVRVKADDDAEALASRVLAMEHQLYPKVLRRFAEGEPKTLHLHAV